MARPPKTYVEDVAQEKGKNLSEIGNKGPIEQTSERDLNLAAFMEDVLTIEVVLDETEGAIPTICPEVNSVKQYIIRGQKQKVKRKYVEALARSRITKQVQKWENPNDPSNIRMIPVTTLTAQFLVHHDPHPDGREWLKNILAQP